MTSKKYFFLFFITACLTILSTHTYAQEVIILPETNLSKYSNKYDTHNFLDSRKINSKSKSGKNESGNFSNIDNPLNFNDTIYTVPDPSSFATNFGFFGQDYMV